MSEWRETTLGEVLTLQRGFDLPSKTRIPGPVPVVSSAGPTGWHNVAKVDPPGVVIGRTGTLGSVYWVTEPYWPLNTALWVKDFKGNDPRYVGHLLATISISDSSAAAVPGVNRNHLHQLPVRIPSMELQRQISALLAAFDELIEINERRIELLENLTRSLYREWFLRFCFPDADSTSVSDAALPAGWSVRPLGEVSENFDRLRRPLSKAERSERQGPYPYFGAAKLIDSVDGWIFEGEHLLFAEDGTVQTERGFPVLQLVDDKFWANNHTHVLRGSTVSTRYLYLACSEYQIGGHITGAAQPKITQANLVRVPVMIAPAPIHAAFDRLINPLFEQQRSLTQHATALARTRDLLLPRLVTGRLDISDVDLGTLLPDEAAA